MTVTDVLGIRLLNTQSIIEAVRYEDAITKREIAKVTGLSFATVSNLCNELIDQGLLLTVKNNALSVGRTPQFLSFNYERYCTIALNLQLNGIMALAVMDFRNQVVIQKEYAINSRLEAEEIIHLAKKHFDTDIKPQMPTDVEMIGIGVAVSSIYDIHTSNLICCAVPQLENVNIKAIVEREFGIRAYVDNEANLCACALLTQHKGNDHIVYIHASEGVGIGVIVQGKLLKGSNGYAGEVAHMPIGNMKHLCKDCGNYGCIERELCIDGILENYFGKEPTERFSQWNKFLSSVKNNEEKALDTVRTTGMYLGRLISVLVNLFDPSAVYIGGDIAMLQDILEVTLPTEVRHFCGSWRKDLPQLVWDQNSEMQINVGISEKICSAWSPN